MWSHWQCAWLLIKLEILSKTRTNVANTKKCNVLVVWSLFWIQWQISDRSAHNIDINRLKAAISTCYMLFDAWALLRKIQEYEKMHTFQTYLSVIAASGDMQTAYENGDQHLEL